MNKEKMTMAIFDFDGTITTKDTLFDFIKFYHGKVKFIRGLFVLSPILIAYKLSILTNNKAKEILFSYYFKNEEYNRFLNYCQQYKYRIKQILQQDTIKELNKHRDHNDKILIISASINEWIKPWAKDYGIETIATNIEVIDNLITGKFSSKNCFGIEKVNRFNALYPNRNNYYIYAYGDSDGDKELLEYSDKSKFYKV